jgi:hypothetical protein
VTGAPPPPRLGRSRTVRAAAIVSVGLAAAGCDEAPLPDTPLDAAERVEACEAAHRRLSADPALCQVLERVARQEQDATRPRFALQAQCEATFGTGACEGGGAPAGGGLWRPALAGWLDDPASGARLPVVRDRNGDHWSLPPPGEPPRPVTEALSPAPAGTSPFGGSSFDRRAPTYDDRLACEGAWSQCEPTALPNRFVEQEGCEAVWVRCQELALPATVVASGNSSGGGGGAHGWYGGYNHFWYGRYSSAYAPRWQGWGWTGDRAPAATYRTAGSGLPQAWDSGSRRLAPARSLASIAGDGALSARTEAVSRAGFGSTGRSYSSGG